MSLQWGGRFVGPADATLLAFGSSLDEDLALAPYDVEVSHAHIDALAGGKIIDDVRAHALHRALAKVAREVADGSFERFARTTGAEDIHGAIDVRIREIEPEHGEWLHTGRSRNDQVATTLALYARAMAERGMQRCLSIAKALVDRAERELAAKTLMVATTHWQPAQPVLLAFWLLGAAEPFVRAAHRFQDAGKCASERCPLGSSALAGSTLPLDREAAAKRLGFERPSRNAMDAIGTRDAALDVAQAYVRALVSASRIAGEIVVWATPAFGYVKLGDASSTGSSLMPQKRNPDPFELMRGVASAVVGSYAGALSSMVGMPLSYHRDLQETKRLVLDAIARGAAALEAFDLALADTTFVRDAFGARAGDGYAVATDLADALVAAGVSARDAHHFVGAVVRQAEEAGRALGPRDLVTLAGIAGLQHLDAPLSAEASVNAKVTEGSTGPEAVRASLASLQAELASFDSACPERSGAESKGSG